jgi:hypothetical protein
MPSAPAGAAEAAAGGDLDGRRDGGAAPPPQTAEEAVATARAYAESISDGMIERDRAGRATDEKYGLSRHWRNARRHASHDPVSRKYHHVGNFMLNDVLPPNHGQL